MGYRHWILTICENRRDDLDSKLGLQLSRRGFDHLHQGTRSWHEQGDEEVHNGRDHPGNCADADVSTDEVGVGP